MGITNYVRYRSNLFDYRNVIGGFMTDPGNVPQWIQDFANDVGAIVTNVSNNNADVGYHIPDYTYSQPTPNGGENAGKET
jgi:hypothetical protein